MKYLVCSLAATLLAVLPAAAKDQLLINGRMQRVNTSSNAVNVPGVTFDMVIGKGKARVTLNCTNVSPRTNFHFVVGGVTQATFSGNVRSNANLFFQNFPGRRAQPLEFDPRGQVILISDDKTNLLTLTVGTTNQPASLRYFESTDLDPVAGAGKAEATYEHNKADLTEFKVRLMDVRPGTFDIYVDGQFCGSINVARGDKGSILFKRPYGNNDLPLNFDPRAKTVVVKKAGAVQFSGVLRAKATGLDP